MKQELISLVAQLQALTGWTDRYVGERFGQSNIVSVLRAGKHGPGINTAERFKEWLLQQLEHEPTQ